MADPFFRGETLDDLMRTVIEAIQSRGERITPSQGPCTELGGVLLELTNPRARLSRTETRGRPFSCLGELCWYLAKSSKLEFIHYYISAYREFADGDAVIGGYGPRLFDWKDLNQLARVQETLARKPDSRRAVIQLFDGTDLAVAHQSIPCTCTMQFMIRSGKLLMFTSMRSNDSFIGLPHDVFAFTMIQEILARDLGVELGTYKHFVGSLHLYDRDRDAAQQFLDEGWQPTDESMPPMPLGEPWSAVALLLQAEAAIRTGQGEDIARPCDLDPYWKDLISLLQVLRCWKDNRCDQIAALRDNMSSSIYVPFVDKKFKDCCKRSP